MQIGRKLESATTAFQNQESIATDGEVYSPRESQTNYYKTRLPYIKKEVAKMPISTKVMKLKMPNKGIIFISIVLFFLNIILSANVGVLIFNETLKVSIQHGKLNANIISIAFGIIGFISTHIIIKKIVDFIYYKLGYNMNKK